MRLKEVTAMRAIWGVCFLWRSKLCLLVMLFFSHIYVFLLPSLNMAFTNLFASALLRDLGFYRFAAERNDLTETLSRPYNPDHNPNPNPSPKQSNSYFTTLSHYQNSLLLITPQGSVLSLSWGEGVQNQRHKCIV